MSRPLMDAGTQISSRGDFGNGRTTEFGTITCSGLFAAGAAAFFICWVPARFLSVERKVCMVIPPRFDHRTRSAQANPLDKQLVPPCYFFLQKVMAAMEQLAM